ncbi:MAG: 2Fe-2S iron-sulfur cluster-binding protein [Prochloraceae cyanobacterium]|nr:2Fe-2S iron-sulfur cluster-binding protein [Prochloraceae cyanobacterium]
MFSSLRKIQNPILKSVISAVTSFAIVTIVGSVVIDLAKSERNEKSVYKLGVYASLIGTAAGAVFGLIIPTDKTKTAKKTDQKQDTVTDKKVWQDWRNFVVTRKVKESEEITSFYLEPEDKEEIPNFKPGQFLTIKLDIPSQQRPVIRTYSLSDRNEPNQYYRLSIKRELAPKGLDVPPGIASNFMHDRIEEGSIIPAKPPNGKFYIDVNKSLPAVLISNGVGITPMIAMAKASSLLNPSKNVWFVHGARNGQYHAFRDEVLAIAQQNSQLKVHYRYSRPQPEDEGHYQSNGYVDATLIKDSILPEIKNIYGSTDAEYFLCGSPAFLTSLREGLAELGVLEERVFFESFSKGSSKVSEKKKTETKDTSEGKEVVFAQSGKTATWQSNDGTILEFAEDNGINPPNSCRAGICLTCMCRIEEGEIEYEEPPTGTPDEGTVLICIAKPKTEKVVLDI